MAKINYAKPMTWIPGYAAAVLLDIMQESGVDEVLITSTTRSPQDQARIMFDNLEEHGVVAQKQLYKAPGQAVIDVYVSCRAMGKNADQVKTEMVRKILELGPQTVSRHCAEPTVKSVFDVAPSSVPDDRKVSFIAAISGNPHIDKFLQPPTDPAYHLEINLADGTASA
jgi:hypothetical protein